MNKPEHRGSGSLMLGHTLGLLAFLAIGVLGGMVYLWTTTNLFGHRPSGFGNAAALVVLPIWSLLFGAAIWLPISIMHRRRWGEMSRRRAAIIALVAALIVTFVFIGPGGYTTRGGAYLMNYYVIVMLVVSALVHHALVRNK